LVAAGCGAGKPAAGASTTSAPASTSKATADPATTEASPTTVSPTAVSPTTVSPAATASPPTAAPTTSVPVRSIPTETIPAYLAGRQGQTTVAVFNAANDYGYTLNSGLVEYTASIVKLQIMGALLYSAELDGQPLTAEQSSLMTTMIENSDNDSATALWNEVGGAPGLSNFDRELGLTQTSPSSEEYIPGTDLPGWGLTTTSAQDQVAMVKALAYPGGLLNSASQQLALRLMENIESDQRWGVTGGVPAGVSVALKNGWLPVNGLWQVNSVGWIDGDGHNYVIAVLSRDNPTESYGIDTIEQISADVYQALG